MLARSFRPGLMFLILGGGLLLLPALRGQDAAPDDAPPPVPKGVEVLARGPVHEAFATLTAEPQPTKAVAKKPPKLLQEMPPDEKPEGNSIWIGGYWAWDDDRSDFLWVSGIWRTPPPGKQWVAGYWRDQDDGAQWVPGFWQPVPAKEDAPQDVTYYPKPPDPPAVAAPGTPPSADTFYVPGHWEWNGAEYVWRAGFWAHVQPNYVWIPSHYRWTPAGYIYVAGYWDYSVKRRGVLYAPVVIDPNVVDASYVYTPAYAVDDTLVVDSLFVRPCTCHYYFGDYYDVSYRDSGFTSCVVYSRSNYDSIVVYETYEHRDDPTWINVQVNLFNDRVAGRAPVPPRTLNQQITVVNNTTVINNTNINNTTVNNTTNNVTVNRQVMKTSVLAPPSKVMAANGAKVVKLDAATRQQAQQQAAAVQQVSVQRTRTEVAAPGGPPKQPHVAALNVPPSHPVAPKTTVAPAAHAAQPPAAQNPKPGPAATPPANTVTNTHVTPAAPPSAPTKPATSPVTPTTLTTPTPPPAVKPTPPATAPLTPPPAPAVTPTKPLVPGQPTPPAHPPTSTTPPPTKRPPPPPPQKDKDKDKDKQN